MGILLAHGARLEIKFELYQFHERNSNCIQCRFHNKIGENLNLNKQASIGRIDENAINKQIKQIFLI